ncbi:MAG: fatty acid desaturase [Paracoccaceae bacterium]
MTTAMKARDGIEWPTLLMLILTYGLWIVATSTVYLWSPVLSVILTGILITQSSSLQHEALHGHPFRKAWLNEIIVSPALTLTVPYGRFRDTHLAHHHDPVLTDPYDDPESNFVDPAVWPTLPRLTQLVLLLNNTLLGRIVLGPLIGNYVWLRGELRRVLAGDRAVQRDWALQVIWLLPVVAWLWVAAMPWWAYALAVWLGHGLLKIRTFLEHRAHELARARTVIVEDKGPLALLFLNNNFHAVHHMHPTVAWYRLPGVYAAQREHYLRRNDGYVFGSYWPIFRDYFLRVKDPVSHPLMEDQAMRRNVGTSPELSKNGMPG